MSWDSPAGCVLRIGFLLEPACRIEVETVLVGKVYARFSVLEMVMVWL